MAACAYAEFSSKWRTRFSHLRGGSYNRTVLLVGRVGEVEVAVGTLTVSIRVVT
jgi:hypothetical protein